MQFQRWLPLTALAAACATVAACAGAPDPNPPRPRAPSIRRLDGTTLTHAEIERTVDRLMAAARVPGVALAIINDGRVAYLGARGWRDPAHRQPLTVDTALPGASFTKAAFALLVMQLVEARRLDLDRPIEHYLDKPLPEHELYRDLAGDDRHRRFTARMLLAHTSGLPNWRRYNDDGKLDIKFEPGSRYGYSGEGIFLLQHVVEQLTDASTTDLMAEHVFRRFSMTRTTMVWRPDLERDHAVGHDTRGRPFPVPRRASPDAAGSMTTTIRDWAALIAALLRGEGLPAAARAELLRPQIRIYSAHQFPAGSAELSHDNDAIRLSYGLGWGLIFTPHGKAYFKEGHDDGVQHYCISFEDPKAAIVIMTNSDNGESIFRELLATLLGDTFTPWRWERYVPYQDRPGSPTSNQYRMAGRG